MAGGDENEKPPAPNPPPPPRPPRPSCSSSPPRPAVPGGVEGPRPAPPPRPPLPAAGAPAADDDAAGRPGCTSATPLLPKLSINLPVFGSSAISLSLAP